MQEEILHQLLSAFVPKEVLDHFEIREVRKEYKVYRLYLVEKSDRAHYPPELSGEKEVVQDGYMHPCEIRTFPIEGHETFLYLRRRRWKAKGTTQAYHNSYAFTEKGIKCTPKFGAFLKEVGRGEADQHW